ncbi:hypothetical protein SLEP1_g24969 [Rubroshorea leprosula]|uniref:Protein kinase domain-containing protein n=1 Tax=Rubroshorea leprosula TaxID=152421 RepID=A0AAV5JR52_9ROSI|nr:hypothetical protein SLEP1_g24969 [Rubroshorea leprosula]
MFIEDLSLRHLEDLHPPNTKDSAVSKITNCNKSMASKVGRQFEMKEKGVSNLVGKVVVVTVKASKEIPRTALIWDLTHVVQPGDCIKLLVVIPPYSSSKWIWGLSRFTSDCTTGHWRYFPGASSDQKDYIADSCSQMMLQLNDVYDPGKVKIRVRIVSSSTCGVVAAEAKKAQSNWVILDNSDPRASPSLLAGIYEGLKKEHTFTSKENQSLFESDSDSSSERLSRFTGSFFHPWMVDSLSPSSYSKHLREGLDFRESRPLYLGILLGGGSLMQNWNLQLMDFHKQISWLKGGFGSVHKAILSDGQAIAVKQHKLASYQGNQEFCYEVEVLSGAQHRNVVMLVGFCIDDGKDC